MKVLLLFSLAVFGCGSIENAKEDTPVSAQEEEVTPTKGLGTALMVLSGERLPVCDEANEGALIFEEASDVFKHCSEGTWVAIDITGRDGEKGEKGEQGDAGGIGPQGEAGADGQVGADSKISAVFYCSMTLDNSVVKPAANGMEAVDLGATPIDFSGIFVSHDVTLLANDDTYVVSTFFDSWKDTKTDFYAGGTAGATQALMGFGYDYAFTSNGGVFFYKLTSSSFVVEYTDNAPEDNYANFGQNSRTVTWTKPLDDCSVSTYD